jgi:hypothetical protein
LHWCMSDSRELKGYGVVREGEPGFSKVTVVVNGDTATVFACVDNSTWVVPGAENGNVPDVLPGGVALERRVRSLSRLLSRSSSWLRRTALGALHPWGNSVSDISDVRSRTIRSGWVAAVWLVVVWSRVGMTACVGW